MKINSPALAIMPSPTVLIGITLLRITSIRAKAAPMSPPSTNHQQQFFAFFLDHIIFMQDPLHNGADVFVIDFAHENIHAIFLQSLTVGLNCFVFCGHIK
jgi:hypothetical protein